MSREIQKFDVGLKAFINRAGKLLIARESQGGRWEVPGGRIDVGEEEMHPHAILQREIEEELGSAFKVVIGQPFYTWVRTLGVSKTKFVYLTGFRCSYVSGDIIISDEHTETRWIDQNDIAMIEFAPGYKEALEQYWKT